MNNRRPGFTLLETTISLGIMVLLSTLVIIYSNRGFETDLNTASSEVAQVLRDAREKTLASRGGSSGTTWGVLLNTTNYDLYCTDSPCDGEQTFSLPQNVQFDVNTQGTNVLFQRLTGNIDTEKVIILEQTGNANETKNLYISSGGAIGDISVSAPLPTIDSRLIKVSNGTQMIQNANDLVIAFKNISDQTIQSHAVAGEIVGDYFVYSDELSADDNTFPVAVVAQMIDPYEVYVYWDGERFEGYDVGLQVSSISFNEIANVDATGEIIAPSDTANYETY